MILVYPLGLWLRSAGVGGSADPPLSTADSLLQLSVEHYQAGRYQEALNTARSALAANPKLAAAYNNMAVSYLQLGKYDDGIAAAQKALQLQPSFEMARNNLAWLEREKAAADLAAVTEPLMQEAINLLYSQKQPEAAVELFKRVLALNPDHYGANYQLAAALQEAGRLDEAQQQWLRALEMARAINDKPTEALILQHLDTPDRRSTPDP